MSERVITDTSIEQIRELLDSLYRVDSGRILATLIRLLGDFDLAEEAMHEASAAALSLWPSSGVPGNPAPAIAPATSAPSASNSASSTASPVPTLPAPTARPSASFKLPCASGPTLPLPQLRGTISISPPGSSVTTSTAPMVVSGKLRPSAARLRWEQRLDRSQLPRPFRIKTLHYVAPPLRLRSGQALPALFAGG
jgi:hypothetical protein